VYLSQLFSNWLLLAALVSLAKSNSTASLFTTYSCTSRSIYEFPTNPFHHSILSTAMRLSAPLHSFAVMSCIEAYRFLHSIAENIIHSFSQLSAVRRPTLQTTALTSALAAPSRIFTVRRTANLTRPADSCSSSSKLAGTATFVVGTLPQTLYGPHTHLLHQVLFTRTSLHPATC
jgi:hypothetical protein